MKIDPNSSEYDAKAGLPDGEHVVFISDVEPEQARTGTDAVKFEFECHDPASEHDGTVSKFNRFYVTEKTTWKLVNLIRAARPDGCPPLDVTVKEDLVRELLDRPLAVTLKSREETYQGRTRDRQEVVKARELNADEKKRLRAKFGDRMVPEMEAGNDDGGFEDDDVPF